MKHLILLGATGVFMRRLLPRLIQIKQLSITLIARDLSKLERLKKSSTLYSNVDLLALDKDAEGFAQVLAYLKPDILINGAGPYEFSNSLDCFKIASVCCEIGCDYIDLADNREFISHFHESLDNLAKASKVVLVTGASSVPALSNAVVEHYQKEFSELTDVAIGICPGNQTERGLGTVSSILSYVGQPFTQWIDGRFKPVYGWQNLRKYKFEHSIGTRWLANCDVPDLELLPKQYPQLQSVSFQAGLEVSLMHIGLWALSWLTRMHWVNNWRRYAKPLVRVSRWMESWGSDDGAMFVELKGLPSKKRATRKRCSKATLPSNAILRWQLIAKKGRGPHVPTIAAELTVKRLLSDRLPCGAYPCTGFLKLDDFRKALDALGIVHTASRNGFSPIEGDA